MGEETKSEGKNPTEVGGGEKDTNESPTFDHPVFKTIADGDMESMRNYFEVEGVSLELEDQHGMTPLMHASWKGRQEVAKYLIKQGEIYIASRYCVLIPSMC